MAAVVVTAAAAAAAVVVVREEVIGVGKVKRKREPMNVTICKAHFNRMIISSTSNAPSFWATAGVVVERA
jgi:hypothetical protein